MTHDISKEIKRMQELTGKTRNEVVEMFGVDVTCKNEVWNRRDESTVKYKVAELEEKIRKEEIRKERLSTYHWVKVDKNWVVAGDFTDKKVGDTITVMKANGQKQEKIIVKIQEDGNAVVK